MTGRDLFEEYAFAGKPVTHCRVIDAHGHIGHNPNFPRPDASLECFVTEMDRMGIETTCISTTNGCFGAARQGNDLVIDAVRQFPGRFFGYMTVDIGYPERIRPEMERCYSAGLRAVKIMSSGVIGGPPYNHENYTKVFEFANDFNLPVLAHTFSVPELEHLEQWSLRFPNLRFVFAHAGAADRNRYASSAQQYANVYLETCFSSCPRGLIEFFVREGLADKVLWGSDAMFMAAAPQLGRVLFAKISSEEKTKILGQNAIRILGIRTNKPIV